jgi:hypothetical protein
MATATASYLSNPLMMNATVRAVVLHGAKVNAEPLGDILPGDARTWLARLRLLEGVPFCHLVADSELLPPESIRFFYVDREWTDALTQGALSIGTVNSLDREHMQTLYARIRDEIDAEERRVRMVGADSPAPAAADTITGFLLRSRAVSGWPALHVRAYRTEIGPDDAKVDEDDPRRIRLLRLERLAPAVLLCLFDGIPEVVHIEEPRQGIQFGVDLVVDAGGDTTDVTIPLRDVLTSTRLDRMEPPPAGAKSVSVPFRKDAPGVIEFVELSRRIAAQPATNVNAFGGAGVESAEMAMEMLQFPFRQVFGDPSKGAPGGKTLAYADLFRPSIQIQTVRTWEGAR